MLPVDFIMHEYLHKYYENIKKLEKNFPEAPEQREPPPPKRGIRGVLPPALVRPNSKVADGPQTSVNQHVVASVCVLPGRVVTE